MRQVLEQRRQERNQPPPTAVVLPDDPRVRDLVVTPHELEHYDPMTEEDPDEHDPSR